MQSGDSESENTGKDSNKKLVRILIIIGIGVPVLVELMTLFNLVNVQLFEDEKQDIQQPESVVQVQEYAQGDTLFLNSPSPVAIDTILIKVSAQEWRFRLLLSAVDTAKRNLPIMNIDSLRLNSGDKLQTAGNYDWNRLRGRLPQIEAEWKLPTGDIPTILFISSTQFIAEDSTQKFYEEAKLGNIPVRYSRGQN